MNGMNELNDKVLIKHGNATPLGLLGFAISILMLSLHYVTAITLDSAVLAMVFVFGFLAQIIAGIILFKKGNTFRASCFTLFSFFYLSLMLIWTNQIIPAFIDKNSFGVFFIVWAVVTAFLCMGIMYKHITIKLAFIFFILFNIFLAIGQFAQVDVWFIIAGIAGLLCALSILINFVIHVCEYTNEFVEE